MTRRAMRCGALTVPAALLLAREPVSPAPQHVNPTKIALVVAVANYAPATGWGTLHADHDVEVIEAALEHQHFERSAIEVIRDASATKAGILAGLARLVSRAAPGDVVVFHYSGHGHQITDDNGDEIDGYDEVLVPYDAPKRPPPSYRGERHIRDDTLGVILRELRRRVGPTGSVVVVIDACYSGSATRGDAPVRGSSTPIGDPAPGARRDTTEGGGMYESPAGARGEPADDPTLSPYVVFSASRHDEPAREARDKDGRWVGSLSLAVSKALSVAGPQSTYRAVFDDVKRGMAYLVPGQTPQVEGNVDVQIFSGKAVSQAPYYEVASLLPGDTLVALKAGTLVGLLPGSVVEFYRAGTLEPRDNARLARGSVIRSDALKALVRLQQPQKRVADSWAFVTQSSFGDLSLRVKVKEHPDHDLRAAILAALKSQRVLKIVQSQGEVTVVPWVPRPGVSPGVLIETTGTGSLIDTLDRSRREIPLIVSERLQDFARNWYLRKLELRSDTLDVRFEPVPVTLRCKVDPATGLEDCVVSDTLRAEARLTAGGQWRFKIGDAFLLRIRNQGRKAAYVSILDLIPDGHIGLLWPLPEQTGQDNLLEPGRDFLVDVPYTVTEPAGIEVLKLMATEEPVDFRMITTRGGVMGRGPRGPLEQLFDEAYRGTRSTPLFPHGAVSTFSLPIQVIP